MAPSEQNVLAMEQPKPTNRLNRLYTAWPIEDGDVKANSPFISGSSGRNAQSRSRPLSSLSSSGTEVTSPTSMSSNGANASERRADTASSASTDIDAWFARFQSDDDLAFDAPDEIPDGATLAAIKDVAVYDSSGEKRSFGSFFDPETSTHQRQLFVFVRHFYCGACQAYLKALTEGISLSDYFRIPVPTAIYVIGCGKPDLIKQYKKFTNCPFPIFADPSRELFKKLGMNVNLKIGRTRPDYMKDISPAQWLHGQAKTIRTSLKDPDGIRHRDIFRGGNPMQIGGEFLFDDGDVVWCHRMKHYRDHTEIKGIRHVLELDG